MISAVRLRMAAALRGSRCASSGLRRKTQERGAAGQLGQGHERRVAREAAVPEQRAADLDAVVEPRQTGRGEDHVGRQLVLAEDVAVAGAYLGGGDQERHRAPLTDEPEIDDFGQELAQGVRPSGLSW